MAASGALDNTFESKNRAIKDLQYEVARLRKINSDLAATYEAKFKEYGISIEDLGFKSQHFSPRSRITTPSRIVTPLTPHLL
jgi:hypothetical protein